MSHDTLLIFTSLMSTTTNYIFLDCMKIGGHGILIACVAPGTSIKSLTKSIFLILTCCDTQLYTSHLIKINIRTGNHVLLRKVDYNDIK